MPARLVLIRIGRLTTQLGDVGGDSAQLITPGDDGYGVANSTQISIELAARRYSDLLKHAVLSAKLVSTAKNREAELIERGNPCKPKG
jgi:hypothetical protein